MEPKELPNPAWLFFHESSIGLPLTLSLKPMRFHKISAVYPTFLLVITSGDTNNAGLMEQKEKLKLVARNLKTSADIFRVMPEKVE
eukprot:100508-Amorphochlora_amoeboformis.AAC.1